jgi:hypothetical protein
VVTEDDIALLLHSLEDKLAVASEYKAHSALFIGADFSIFRFIDYESNLSAILADLLDPSGSHGQGIVFLALFIDMIEKSLPSSLTAAMALREMRSSKRVLVKRELITGRKRFIDIVVSDGKLGIGIENKPFAKDLTDQLKHYALELSKRYRQWILLYLPGRAGTKPEKASISQELRYKYMSSGNYLDLCYAEDLADWTEACIHACEAEKVRWFLRDFRDFSMTRFKDNG